MKSLVVYFSRGGKTKKVAEAIAQELGCKAIDIKQETPDPSEVDMLVIGSGNYGGNTDKTLRTFIYNLQLGTVKKAAVFATSGGSNPKVISVLQQALDAKGYNVVSSFKCRGKFLFTNRGRPNKEDLKNAKAFARDLMKSS